MLAICNPHPNWIPKKPKLMFQISQNPRFRFSIIVRSMPDVDDVPSEFVCNIH